MDAYRGPSMIDIATLLNESSLVQSKSDARRLIDQGGIRINGEVFHDPRGTVSKDQLQGAVIKIGKRGYVSRRSAGPSDLVESKSDARRLDSKGGIRQVCPEMGPRRPALIRSRYRGSQVRW